MRTRSLKIEEAGDFHRNKTVPKIRLTGKWLARMGFLPGQRVAVHMLSPGVLQLTLGTPSA